MGRRDDHQEPCSPFKIRLGPDQDEMRRWVMWARRMRTRKSWSSLAPDPISAADLEAEYAFKTKCVYPLSCACTHSYSIGLLMTQSGCISWSWTVMLLPMCIIYCTVHVLK